MDAEEVVAYNAAKIIFGVLGFLGGGIIAIIAVARKIGTFEQRLEDAEKHNVEITNALVKLREYHDTDMKEVRDFFRSPDGGQKFITFLNHDAICERNTKLVLQQYQVMNDLLRGQTAEIARLSAEVAQLSTAVAVLQANRIAWRPPPPIQPSVEP